MINAGMEIEFLAEERDYSVAEFFEKFHIQLPVVVKVNQGFQGYIIEDTFSKGEMLYIAAISKQKRVAAKVQSGGGRHRMLSIPAAFSENLCIVKRGKCGQESTLSDIIRHHRLPLKVQFPPNDVIITGGKSFSSKQLPTIKLLKTFEETYLLGNLLTDGKLDKTILHVPVYLSQLRLCLVTGIKHLSEKGWQTHCKELKQNSRHLEYDLLFGNQYVAEFDSADLHADTHYEFIEPTKYDTILNLIQHWPECHFMSSISDTKVHHSKETVVETTKSFLEHHEKRCKSLASDQSSEGRDTGMDSSESENEDLVRDSKKHQSS